MLPTHCYQPTASCHLLFCLGREVGSCCQNAVHECDFRPHFSAEPTGCSHVHGHVDAGQTCPTTNRQYRRALHMWGSCARSRANAKTRYERRTLRSSRSCRVGNTSARDSVPAHPLQDGRVNVNRPARLLLCQSIVDIKTIIVNQN